MNDPAQNLAEARKALHGELRKCIVGQEHAAELLFITLLCGGHALLLGVPGVGKTLLAATLARALKLDFRRIQFTPDLMPADITGTEVLEEDPTSGKHKRAVITGPLFTNVLLADEINRTPPKTQAALLQAMQEGEVTIGCETHRLAPPFFVLATQNPIEMEGVYPLPEAQLDRFLCCVRIAYPSHEEEVTIATTGPAAALGTVEAVLGPDQISELQRAVRAVPVAKDVASYAVHVVGATRPGQNGSAISGLTEYLDCGASPRASQALIAMAKARALLHGRVHVDFADIRALAPEILRHRLILNFRARAEKLDADVLVGRALEHVKTEAP